MGMLTGNLQQSGMHAYLIGVQKAEDGVQPCAHCSPLNSDLQCCRLYSHYVRVSLYAEAIGEVPADTPEQAWLRHSGSHMAR